MAVDTGKTISRSAEPADPEARINWRTTLLAALAVICVLEAGARFVVSQSSFNDDLLPRLLTEHRENAEERGAIGIDTEVLFFGSSTTGAAFDPNLVEGSYDLWWAGAGTRTMAEFSGAFASELFAGPDTVIVGITSRELNDSRAAENVAVLADATRSLAWRRVANRNPLTRLELAASSASVLVRERAHLRRPTSWIAWALVDPQPEGLTIDATGRLTRYRNRSGAPMSEADLDRERLALSDYTVGGEQAAGLVDALRSFGDRQVVLVFLPVSSHYADLHPDGQADIDEARVVAAAAASAAGADFLDLSTLLSDPQYFGDANHLNQLGSEILTQTVVDELGL